MCARCRHSSCVARPADLARRAQAFAARGRGRCRLSPAVATPAWSVEGLAVGVESSVAGFGRLHGSYHEMIVRTAALEDEIDDIHRLSSSSPVWPGPSRSYIYGSSFMGYLTRRFGRDSPPRI